MGPVPGKKEPGRRGRDGQRSEGRCNVLKTPSEITNTKACPRALLKKWRDIGKQKTYRKAKKSWKPMELSNPNGGRTKKKVKGGEIS